MNDPDRPLSAEASLIRRLPFSLIAEQSLLASVLVDPDSFTRVADMVTAEDFYLEAHRQIFCAMHELFLTDSGIDVVTLIDRLVQGGVYTRAGGEDYIRTIADTVPDALNVRDYARIVKEKSLLRALIGACEEISESAYSEEGDVERIIDAAENRIYAVTAGRNTAGFRRISEVLSDVFTRLQDLAVNKREALGTPTGFSAIDRVLAGMGKSDLILIGARPGMGKTSLVLNIASNVAAQTDQSVCIFSLEMSCSELVTRMISSEAMVDSYALRTGVLTNEDWESIAAAAARLARCKILIDDTTDITVTAMKAKLRRVKDPGLVVIDYLQLMQGDGRAENRTQEVSAITRAMKIMAKELNIPVICCSQLSRSSVSHSDRRPQLSDLRDSGSIEQDADVVLFIHRDDAEQGDASSPPPGSIAEIIVAKNRHGSTGSLKLGWIGRYTKFRTLTDDAERPSG